MEYKNSESFNQLVAKTIFEHQVEFDAFLSEDKKISAVKLLKSYVDGDIRSCKLALDLYIDHKLKPYISIERKEKINILNKKIIIADLLVKLKCLNIEELLNKISIDILLEIDEIVDNELDEYK